MNLHVIKCDVCPVETAGDNAEGWQKFQHRFGPIDEAPPIDVCPHCADRLREAIAGVLTGKPPAVALESLALVEQRQITNVLTLTGWNKSLAAKTLGIERSTLDRKLKLYGMSRSTAAVAAQGVAP